MKIEEIDPRRIVFDSPCAVEVTLRDQIQEHGLKDLQETIAVRLDGDAYKAVMGAKVLRAVLSLLDENAECYDDISGRKDRAWQVYSKVPVQVLG